MPQPKQAAKPADEGAEQALAQAQRDADEIRAQAQREADEAVVGAKQKAEEDAESIRAKAREDADQLIGDALDELEKRDEAAAEPDSEGERAPYVVLAAMVSYSSPGPDGTLLVGDVGRLHEIIDLVPSEARRLAPFVRPATEVEVQLVAERKALAEVLAHAPFSGPTENPYGGQQLMTDVEHAEQVRAEQANRAAAAAS